MKEFFEQCLRDLHRLTGLKQYFEICNKSTEKEAKEEMEIIVMGMVRVSEKFDYIPQDAQKRIVAHQIVSDPEMYALNAKIVYKWFNAVSDKYWHESGHLETNELSNKESNAIPLEQCKPEIQQEFRAFMDSLASGTIQKVPKVSPFDLEKVSKGEDLSRNGPKAAATTYHSNENLIEISEKKMAAAKKRGLDKLDFRDLKSFQVEDQKIVARTLEEAREIYLEVYN